MQFLKCVWVIYSEQDETSKSLTGGTRVHFALRLAADIARGNTARRLPQSFRRDIFRTQQRADVSEECEERRRTAGESKRGSW